MRIAMYGAGMRQWGRIDPRCLFEDRPSPAGSELAMMGVSHALASRGHHVQVFFDCEPGLYDGVEYYRPELAIPMLTAVPADVIVAWGDASLFLYPVKAKLKVLMTQSSNMGLGQAAEVVDRYFAISRKSAQLLLDSEPYADPKRMWITRNGVFLTRFGWTPRKGGWACPKENPERDRHRIVWASSPDRGLHHLVDIFQLVKKEVPDAKLTVAYDFDRADKSYHENMAGSTFARFLEKARQLKSTEGVEVVQHLSQPQLATLLKNSGVFAYPCDPVHPTETYCTVVNEAMAAGMPVILSDADCLPENYAPYALVLDRPIDHGEWAREIIDLMKDEAHYESGQTESHVLAQNTDVSGIAEEWEFFFRSFLEGKETNPDKGLASLMGK